MLHGIVFFHTITRLPLGVMILEISDRDVSPDAQEEEQEPAATDAGPAREGRWFRLDVQRLAARRMQLSPTTHFGSLPANLISVPLNRGNVTQTHFVDGGSRGGPDAGEASSDDEWERVTGYSVVFYDPGAQCILLSNEEQLEWLPLLIGHAPKTCTHVRRFEKIGFQRDTETISSEIRSPSSEHLSEG
jgi:hypothetical protein